TIGSHTALRLVRRLINRPAGGAAPQLWFVTRGAQPVGGDDHPLVAAQTPLIGFGRVLLNEHPEFRCRLVDLGPADDAAVAARALVHEFDAADREDQVAWRGGVRYVHRLTRMSNLDSPRPAERGLASDVPCRLQIGRHGMLDQLRLRPIERRAPEPHEVEVAVCAAGVNFRDVMKALGIYPGDAPDADSLGDEFAGVVTRVGSAVTARRVGERVFGVCLGAMATHVTVDAGVCMPLPDDMSFEEGATIPVVYLTAYRALNQLARMQPGERVLVHSAAGGVGHAATRLALQAGLEVFGTAGSPAKRQMLRNIGVHHVFNSRTLDFADEIMAVTKGEGIDIVLNSLAGDAIPRSLELLRLNGRFLEIGKRDIYGGTAVSLKPFRNSLAYFAIDMARELVPPHAGPLLEEIRTLLGRDVVRPLPFQSFPFGEVAAAFRYMAQGKHNGKIVLTIDQTALARRSAYNASRGAFRGDATYLITGGLRGFGLAFAEHLVARGARHLVLTSQSGPTSEESQTGIERLRSQGVNVLACKSDAASESDVSALLAEIDRTMPPLAGVIHAATTYADALIRDLDTTSFERPMIPKAYGAWNLHRATLGRRLDLFVTISSISAVVGNTGQANYVAANAFLDALAETRRRQYLPGLSLQLDRIRDVGHVARDQALTDRFARLNWWGISAAQALEGFDRLLANDPPVGLVTSFNWMKTSSGLGPLLASPRFEQVVREESAAGDDEGSAAIRRRLDAASPDQKSDIIRTFLLREIADVLRTSPRKLSVEAPLKDIGMDSLMAVELMARVESKLGMTLPAQQLSAESTVMTITAAALTLLGVAPTRAAAPAAKE
ncbi:MAG: SDR family NAD(P)-dependent oxidoreductase, partial [Planctomycetaceae bacterium]|nr:SDR family NAD(P)-dependent oxidoreductase [Planctomycetaceae bacterium]